MSVDWEWTRVVFDHVKITACDPGASIAFYKTVLEPRRQAATTPCSCSFPDGNNVEPSGAIGACPQELGETGDVGIRILAHPSSYSR